MKMEVVPKDLIPGMQYCDESEFPAQTVFGVLAVGGQGLRYRFEKNAQNYLLIAKGDGIDLMGQGKDIMKISYREQFLLPGLQPSGFIEGLALWTMAITAGVVGRLLVAAGIALLHMAAET